MKKIIEKAIIKVHGTKRNYARSIGIKENHVNSKIKTIANHVKRLDEYLKPIGLKGDIKEEKPGESHN